MRHTWNMFSKTWILLIRGQGDFIVKCGPCYFQIPWLKFWLQNAIRPSRWCVEITLNIVPWLAGADQFEYALGFCADPFLPGFPEPRSDLSSCRKFCLNHFCDVLKYYLWPDLNLARTRFGIQHAGIFLPASSFICWSFDEQCMFLGLQQAGRSCYVHFLAKAYFPCRPNGIRVQGMKGSSWGSNVQGLKG